MFILPGFSVTGVWSNTKARCQVSGIHPVGREGSTIAQREDRVSPTVSALNIRKVEDDRAGDEIDLDPTRR